MSIKYIDRAGKTITAKEWKEKRDDPLYSTVKEYDNGVVKVTLKWSGRVANPQNTYAEFWPVFILLVKNYRSDGSCVDDPVDGDRTYPTEAAGDIAYQTFLLKWTECETSEHTDEFVEFGNSLAPEPPPDPNKPATQSEELGDTGAW